MSATNESSRATYTRTVKRSNTIASTLLVLGLALLIVLIVNNWNSLALILRALGVSVG